MIGWDDLYKVVVAMVPLYIALILGYGSVKWWKIFTPEQCDAINKLVCYFTLPLFSFEFTAHVDPFKMNYRFVSADAISKVLIVVVLVFWAKCSKDGSYCWSITSFSLSALTNSLVVGVPLLKAMYGPSAVDLVVQSSVIQSIVWLTILLFVLEVRRSRNDFPTVENGRDLEGDGSNVTITKPSFWGLMKIVWMKLAMNPNSYACILGITWAFLSNRWNFEMPSIMEGSILIMSRAGTGTAMFSMGLFMALQEKVIACGCSLTVLAMVLRFIAGPAAMAIAAISVGLQGDLLHVAIIQSIRKPLKSTSPGVKRPESTVNYSSSAELKTQHHTRSERMDEEVTLHLGSHALAQKRTSRQAALPQSITSFIYAKEYGLHADVLSTAVIFGMIVSLPMLVAYYAILEFLR